MRFEDIRPGQVLLLKPERAQAYGLPRGTPVRVTGTQTRPGYKVGFVLAGTDAYRPSDFSRAVETGSAQSANARQ